MATKEPTVSYNCKIYGEAGGVWASGPFVLARIAGNSPAEPAGFSDSLVTAIHYSSWDGETIHLQASGLALVPDGVVDFPFGDGHGKKEQFDLGRSVSPAVEY